MEDLRGFQGAVQKACHVFGVEKLFPEQENALKAFISREDVLLNLPTGFGKSLVFQMAPLVHAELSKFNHRFTANPIIIVISPLASLMEDQTIFLRNLNIKAGYDKSVNGKIEKGECSIVFSSPESLLGNGRWRNMLSSDTYKENLIGIVVDEAHCISHW
ncbi:putative ATP-dependent DNA helicase Q1 [Acropora millepora]|uniref:putative ATP-dependent DNA helicase Q1 n=1 Tax=Acropora millepora TaxID=45264 RepID=UPI001CF10902|nr:putative ATP-dependent DNA helicase Q1 [Acropora millepora]